MRVVYPNRSNLFATLCACLTFILIYRIFRKEPRIIHGVRDIRQEYQILHLSKKDAMGKSSFYTGIHLKTGKSRTIRIVRRTGNKSKTEPEMEYEIAIMKKLRSHPTICELMDVVRTKDKYYIVVEKLNGTLVDVMNRTKQHTISEGFAKFLMTQILVGVKQLHMRNVVHGDLTLEKFYTTSLPMYFTSPLKLCDFDMARYVRPNASSTFWKKNNDKFRAPEVGRKTNPDLPQDIWKLGLLMYKMLVGTLPFASTRSIVDLMNDAAFMYPPRLWRNISADAVDLIGQMLIIDPQERYTVDHALNHSWFEEYKVWRALRDLELHVGFRYLTHEEDDEYWTKDEELPDFPN